MTQSSTFVSEAEREYFHSAIRAAVSPAMPTDDDVYAVVPALRSLIRQAVDLGYGWEINHACSTRTNPDYNPSHDETQQYRLNAQNEIIRSARRIASRSSFTRVGDIVNRQVANLHRDALRQPTTTVGYQAAMFRGYGVWK